jgi:hypothetical protein
MTKLGIFVATILAAAGAASGVETADGAAGPREGFADQTARPARVPG